MIAGNEPKGLFPFFIKEDERMLPTSGKVWLEWDNGERVELGSAWIESNRKGTEFIVQTKFKRMRYGWEFVKFGLRQMLFGGRKSKSGRD